MRRSRGIAKQDVEGSGGGVEERMELGPGGRSGRREIRHRGKGGQAAGGAMRCRIGEGPRIRLAPA